MTARLAVDRIAAGYGGIEAINDVSIEVGAGEAVALIGANGAGKTTTLRSIVGLLVLRSRPDRFGRHSDRADGA